MRVKSFSKVPMLTDHHLCVSASDAAMKVTVTTRGPGLQVSHVLKYGSSLLPSDNSRKFGVCRS